MTLIDLAELTMDAGESMGAIGVSNEAVLALVDAASRLRANARALHAWRAHPGSFEECANAVCATDREILERFDFGGVR